MTTDTSKVACESMAQLFETLDRALEGPSALFRLDLSLTSELEEFQIANNAKMDSLNERAKLAAVQTGSFRWWQVTGTWPRDDGGWMLLLGKATFQIKARQSPVQRALNDGFSHPGEGQRRARE